MHLYFQVTIYHLRDMNYEKASYLRGHGNTDGEIRMVALSLQTCKNAKVLMCQQPDTPLEVESLSFPLNLISH